MQRITLLLSMLALVGSCHAQSGDPTKSRDLGIDSLVNAKLAEKQIPSIAIGVVKDGEVEFAKGYGYASVEHKIPADESTIYQLGSVTKMFTGHLLAQLITQQRISISDTLAHFFPPSVKFPKAPNGKVVTIKEIATHSAEFPRYPDNLERVDPYPIKGYTKEQMLKGIEQVTIDTAIGVRYNYSNFGYGVLGTAMGNLANKDLSTLMAEHIFKPYKMNSTSMVLTEELKDRLSTPYLEVSPLQTTEPWDMGTLSGAGNIFSSISDLNLFMITLMDSNTVNQTQQTKYLRINESWSYGLGCFIIDSKSRKTPIIYHGGDVDGYASSLTFYPEHQFGFVLLTNWGSGQNIGPAFTAISDAVVDHYLGPIEEK